MRFRVLLGVLLLALVVGSGVLAGVLLAGDDAGTVPGGTPSPTPPTGTSSGTRLDIAVSEPVEDSLYPEVGDPGVDALHYDLDLTWTPTTRTLDGVATVTFRSTADAAAFRLDLGDPLEVSSVRVDGAAVEHAHDGKDLVVEQAVTADQRYTAEIAYAGTPEAVPAPTERTDIEDVGWTITDADEVWTMQEPFGAYTWFPVNDHPSDKALYDFTIAVPSPWVGVANGSLESRTRSGAMTVTRWHLDEPAASYLTTIAIGDYAMTEDETASGVPVTYWTPRSDPDAVDDLDFTVPAIDWLEQRLGPYPFSTAGAVTVDSSSAMETQTMPTYGSTPYARSRAVVLHELAHQWYGDQVTPTDWSDLWMNEGMAMYLQMVWEAEDGDVPLTGLMNEMARSERDLRRQAGPPGDFDPTKFGNSNAYYGPALMWHELRLRLGDSAFWAMARAWPSVHDNGNATRAEYLAWVEQQTGEELGSFFDAWLLGERTPPRS